MDKKLVIFLVFSLICLGLFFMFNYSKLKTNKPVENQQKEDSRDLLDRCGKIPDDLDFSHGLSYPLQVDEFSWSPDCKYIAWSTRDMSVYSAPIDSEKYEGLFLYSDRTKSITHLLKPIDGDYPVMKEWKDAKSIIYTLDIYTADEKDHIYILSKDY